MKKGDSSATWCDGCHHADGLGRRAIGTEVNKSYCQVIVRQRSQCVLWPANASDHPVLGQDQSTTKKHE